MVATKKSRTNKSRALDFIEHSHVIQNIKIVHVPISVLNNYTRIRVWERKMCKPVSKINLQQSCVINMLTVLLRQKHPNANRNVWHSLLWCVWFVRWRSVSLAVNNSHVILINFFSVSHEFIFIHEICARNSSESLIYIDNNYERNSHFTFRKEEIKPYAISIFFISLVFLTISIKYTSRNLLIR